MVAPRKEFTQRGNHQLALPAVVACIVPITTVVRSFVPMQCLPRRRLVPDDWVTGLMGN
jgi:hypothetical protein